MPIILGLFFLATLGLTSTVAGVAWYILDRRALTGAGTHTGGVFAAELLKPDTLSTISLWDRVLARIDYIETVRARLREAGMSWTAGRLTSLMLLAGACGFVLVWRAGWIPGPLCLAAGIAGAVTPYAYVLSRRRRRLRKFESEFPEALDSLARALRAGHPLAAGLQILVYEAPEPVAGELRATLHERQLGRSWDQALDNLANRVPLVEVSVFVAATKLQNRTGGKLSEILGRLSESMREAYALSCEVRAVAAHGRITGRVLTVLPVLLALVMAVVSPSYMAVLWKNPVGQHLLAGAVASLVLAQIVIAKLTDVRL